MKSSKGQKHEKKPASASKNKVRLECSAEPGSQVCVARS